MSSRTVPAMNLPAAGTRGPSRPLPIDQVTITDAFWSPRIEQVRTTTIPQQEHQLRTGGQFEALSLMWRPGDENEPHIFWESDVAKWIEAASYSLSTHPDPELEAAVDEAISRLGSAQQEDGYLNVYFTVVRPGERFTDLRDAHELYCAGHLMEAAAAHFAATGKTSLLDIVRRYADLLVEKFGPGGELEGGYDGHQEIELGLIKLSDASGDLRYRALAKKMIDDRGTTPYYFDLEAERRGTPGYFGFLFHERPKQPQRYREYNQSHLPVREQRDAVGHSVRAMYMYAAMTDLAQGSNDTELQTALQELWTSTTERKMYLTGGIGSDPSIEGFGKDFDLSVDTAYAETCAAIGLVFWARRMAELTGEGRFIDVLERALFNGVLSGASNDGRHYFYANPMRSRGDVERNEWFDVACCPPNYARLLQSLETYIYAQSDDTAIVNLFVSGTARFIFDQGILDLAVQSAYPWEGSVSVEVTAAPDAESEVALRVPGWARTFDLLINGERLDVHADAGYIRLHRQWSPGDSILLRFPITPRRTWANPAVEASGGRFAIERGPLVYCLEGVDNGGDVAELSLSTASTLHESWNDDIGAVQIFAAGSRHRGHGQELYSRFAPRTEPATVTAVPYYQWSNRERSTMEIWIRHN